MIRTVYLALVLVLAALTAAVFAWLNPDQITLDIAFAEVTVSTSLAFAVAVAIGWLLGWLSAALVLARAKAEQFFMKRRLRRAHEELKQARRIPEFE
jgi:uncharacterized membrane protein YciS (DUF1049 family)